jgi:hypothetical protein
MSCETGNVTGTAVTSAARTAYPSIPLDANSGRSTVDLMSVAATQP